MCRPFQNRCQFESGGITEMMGVRNDHLGGQDKAATPEPHAGSHHPCAESHHWRCPSVSYIPTDPPTAPNGMHAGLGSLENSDSLDLTWQPGKQRFSKDPMVLRCTPRENGHSLF